MGDDPVVPWRLLSVDFLVQDFKTGGMLDWKTSCVAYFLSNDDFREVARSGSDICRETLELLSVLFSGSINEFEKYSIHTYSMSIIPADSTILPCTCTRFWFSVIVQ